MKHQTDRRVFLRRLLASASALVLTGCDKLSNSGWFGNVLSTGESLNKSAHYLLRTRKAMAQEFSEADLSPNFRSNGTSFPESAEYQTLAKDHFKDWSLDIGGLVEKPISNDQSLKLSLAKI